MLHCVSLFKFKNVANEAFVAESVYAFCGAQIVNPAATMWQFWKCGSTIKTKKFENQNTLVITKPLVTVPQSPLKELLVLLKQRWSSIVFVCSNYAEFRPHFRDDFVNVQTLKLHLNDTSMRNLADSIIRYKSGLKSVIFMRFDQLDTSPYAFKWTIQMGFLPERAYLEGSYDNAHVLIQQLQKRMNPTLQRLYDPRLISSPGSSHDDEIHTTLLKQRSLELCYQEMVQVLDLFVRVTSFCLKFRETDDSLMLIVHFKIPKNSSSDCVSPLDLISPRKSRGKCSRSQKPPASPLSPSVPIMVLSSSGKAVDGLSPPPAKLWK